MKVSQKYRATVHVLSGLLISQAFLACQTNSHGRQEDLLHPDRKVSALSSQQSGRASGTDLGAAPKNTVTSTSESVRKPSVEPIENNVAGSDANTSENDAGDESDPEAALTDEEELVDNDSERSPEELDELVQDAEIGIEGSFALCEDSIYLTEWQKQFDASWMTQNASRYKKASVLNTELRDARSQAFLKLISPAVDVTSFDYPVLVTADVIKWMQYFQTRGRGAFVTWLRRAEDVIPKMKPVLSEHGLPEDLVYLAMIESGFNNRAMSWVRAAGPWQFMRATGKQYGLRVDDYVDERRDPAKSTRAAAEYLTNLYTMFGDWHLAAASYNAGEGRIMRARRGTDDANFWTLSEQSKLPNETRNYIPKLIAAMIISKNPQKFGFDVTQGSRAIKSKQLKLTRSIALSDLAAATKVDIKILENLNPELSVGITPPPRFGSHYEITVPEAQYALFGSSIADLPKPSGRIRVATRLRQKETMGRLAARHGMPVSELLAMNPQYHKNSKLQRGQLVAIPVRLGTGQYERLTSNEVLSPKRKLKSHSLKLASSKQGKRYRKVASLRMRSLRKRELSNQRKILRQSSNIPIAPRRTRERS